MTVRVVGSGGRPVPFANVLHVESGRGVIADEGGVATLEIAPGFQHVLVRHGAFLEETVEIAVPPSGLTEVRVPLAAVGEPYPTVRWEFERLLRSPVPEAVLSRVGEARLIEGPSLGQLTDDVGLGESTEPRPVGIASFGVLVTPGDDSTAEVNLWVAWDIDGSRVLAAFTEPREMWVQSCLGPADGGVSASECVEGAAEFSRLDDRVPKRTLVEVLRFALRERAFDLTRVGQVVIRPRFGRTEFRLGPDRRIVDDPDDYEVQWVIHAEGGRFPRRSLPSEAYATTKVLVRSDEDLRRGRTILCN